MTWLLPFDSGIVMGLLFAWPVIAFAGAFRLFSFPDLTVEGSFPIGAATCAVSLINGLSVPLAIVLAAASGACFGALTALIHTQLRINKFLSGIVVVAISYTLGLRLMNGSNVGLINQPSIFDFGRSLESFVGSQFQFGSILLLGTILVIGSILRAAGTKTLWGVRLRVAGSSPEYASALGIHVPFSAVITLACTNALVAAAGALLAMYQGFADIGMGQGLLILALASMTIGERIVPERSLSIPSYVVVAAIVGSLTYQVLIAYAVRFGLAVTDLKMATAMFVLAVIAVRFKRHDDSFFETIR